MTRKTPIFPLVLPAVVVLLSTFLVIVQFTSQPKNTSVPVPASSPTSFVCPETDWVDCMPSPGKAKPQCQKEYLDWAKVNCPDFQGAAL